MNAQSPTTQGASDRQKAAGVINEYQNLVSHYLYRNMRAFALGKDRDMPKGRSLFVSRQGL
jgi:hypothetical protein